MTTISGESAAIGEDFDKNIEQIAHEENIMTEKGIAFSGPGKYTTTVTQESNTDDDSDDEDKTGNSKNKNDKEGEDEE